MYSTSLLAKLFRKKEVEIPSHITVKKVSIIIVNYNGKELLKECLPSVIDEIKRHRGEKEVIVIDNGSTDGSVEFIKENFPEVKVVELPYNMGFIGGANCGFKESSGDIVVLLNNDMKVEKGFLEKLLEPFSAPDVFSTTSQIFFFEAGKRREETGKTRGVWSRAGLNIWHSERIDERWENVLYSGGGSSAYRRDILLKLGGFDRIYEPFYVEDTDLSYMAWKRGLKSILVPQSVVYHKHRGTIGRLYGKKEIESILLKNRILFVWKNISDIKMLASHFLYLPLLLAKRRREGVHLSFVITSLIKSFPSVIKRRFNEERERKVSDREILKITRLAYPTHPLKILMVIPYYLYPPIHGGGTRMFNVVKHLSKKHRLYLLSFSDGYENESQKTEMEKYCEKVEIIKRDGGIIRNITSINPTPVVEFSSNEMRRAIREMIENHEPDIVHIEYTHMGQYLDRNLFPIYCITEHDIAFEFFETKYKMERNILKKLADFWEFLRTFHYEIQTLKKYDCIITVTERDAEYLKKFLKKGAPVYACPTGVDTEYYSYKSRKEREEKSVLFIGYFLHSPNVDAVMYFHSAIYPELKKMVKDVKVYIVGAYPTKEILELHRDDFIITGKVPSTKEYYQTKMVFINPVRYGAGIKLKTLEAMSCGIPVVTSSCGARGINARNGEDMFITDDPKEFAEKVALLLEDETLWEKLSLNSRKIVEENFDWRAIVSKLERLYMDLLKRKHQLLKL